MIRSKYFILSLLLATLISCGGNKKASELFAIQIKGKSFQQGQRIPISLKNKKGKTIDQITYTLDHEPLVTEGTEVILDSPTLGNKTLSAIVTYEGITDTVNKNIQLLAAKGPSVYTYEILNEFPHDPKAYTQGLEFYNNTLYESTGQRGKSSLRKVNFETGQVLKQVDLEDHFFGEGLTVLNGKLYQLTWQSKKGFVYDPETLEKLQTFSYGQSKEGWGLCNDGAILYKSDGTEKIWMLDPETLQEKSFIQTVTNKGVFNRANELEYVDGKIYANVYQKESMMIIDPKSGAIEGVINFGGLKEKVTQHQLLDVLNGVAYHPERKTFFVTGKNWDKLFEVKIVKK